MGILINIHEYILRQKLYYKNLTNVIQLLQKAIDVPEYNSHLFRFPWWISWWKNNANLKAEAVTLLEQNNIMHVDWNALTGDAEKSSPDEEYLMNNLQKQLKTKKQYSYSNA